jgi:hypothetical protein
LNSMGRSAHFFNAGGGLEDAADLVDRVGDCTREQSECHDDAECEDREYDAVLGHRLTFLDAEAGADVMHQIRESHS